MKGAPGASLSWGSPIQAFPIRKLIECLSKNPYVLYAGKRVPQGNVMILAKSLRLLARGKEAEAYLSLLHLAFTRSGISTRSPNSIITMARQAAISELCASCIAALLWGEQLATFTMLPSSFS